MQHITMKSLTREGQTMTFQEAIRILMLSPCYWRLQPRARMVLVREYCASFNAMDRKQRQRAKKTEDRG